jgi:hypothetical protein
MGAGPVHESHNTVGFIPAGDTLINEGIYQYLTDFLPLPTINMHPFAIRGLPGTIIALQLNKRFVMIVAKGIAKSLDHGL